MFISYNLKYLALRIIGFFIGKVYLSSKVNIITLFYGYNNRGDIEAFTSLLSVLLAFSYDNLIRDRVEVFTFAYNGIGSSILIEVRFIVIKPSYIDNSILQLIELLLRPLLLYLNN